MSMLHTQPRSLYGPDPQNVLEPWSLPANFVFFREGGGGGDGICVCLPVQSAGDFDLIDSRVIVTEMPAVVPFKRVSFVMQIPGFIQSRTFSSRLSVGGVKFGGEDSSEMLIVYTRFNSDTVGSSLFGP